MHRILIAGTVVFIGVGTVMADRFPAFITKVDGNKVSFYTIKFDNNAKPIGKSKERTLSAEGAKIAEAKGAGLFKKPEVGDAIQGGLKNELFSQPKVWATITTEGDKITEILVFREKKSSKKKNQ